MSDWHTDCCKAWKFTTVCGWNRRGGGSPVSGGLGVWRWFDLFSWADC